MILKDILLFLPLQPACCLRAASHSGLITIRVKGNVASSLSAAPFPIFHGSVCRQRRQTAVLRRPNEPALPRCALVPHDSPAILSRHSFCTPPSPQLLPPLRYMLLNNVPHTLVKVDIAKGETRSEEIKRLNRRGKVCRCFQCRKWLRPAAELTLRVSTQARAGAVHRPWRLCP